MYICVCQGITDKQIQEAVMTKAVCSTNELCQKLGVASCCGQCRPYAHEIVEATLAQASSVNS